MPEPENPKPRQPRRKTVDSEQPKPNLCHIHDEVADYVIDRIREDVCNKTEPLQIKNGKYYCLFHLPSNEKNSILFEQYFTKKLKEINANNLAVNQFPIHNIGKIKLKTFDFRYVWFPIEIKLNNYRFNGNVYFTKATFKENSDFSGTSFEGNLNCIGTKFYGSSKFTDCRFFGKTSFILAKFEGLSEFSNSQFHLDVSFSSASFSGEAFFAGANFEKEAYFDSTKFCLQAYFTIAKFNGLAYFYAARFNKITFFKYVNFEATVDFTKTRFSKFDFTSFKYTHFKNDVIFDRVRFNNHVDFTSSVFSNESDVFFRHTFFSGMVDFQYTNSEGLLRFRNLRQGKDCRFDFQEAAFEKANRISFHTMWLEPNWFVNVDPRKFVFTDIDWGKTIKWRTGRSYWEKLKFAAECIASGFRQVFWKSDEILSENIDGELKRLEERGIKEQKKRLLEIACRQLSVNAEENNRYSEASQFRYMAMETKRLENKGIWRFLNLHWFYKWTSGYGESWRRALVVLVAILAIFGFLYSTPLANFDYGEKPPKKVESFVQQVCNLATMKGNAGGLNGCDSAFYSLAVSALQKPEPKPADSLTKFLVILQTILAPLQAALLALAIRRKFMR